LAFHGLVRLVLDDLYDVDQSIQLLRDLLEGLAVDLHDDRHAGEPFGLGRTHRQGIDVVAARSEQPRHPRENARPVFNENRQGMKAHAIGASAGSVVGSSPSGPTMMSSLDAPAGTIGKHISLGSTRKSITTLRSSIDNAF